MKSTGKAWLAAGVLAAFAAACASDPTSDLRNGPARLALDRRYVVQSVGDTDVIAVRVLDTQGNAIEYTGPTFASADPTVADMQSFSDTTLATVPNRTRYQVELIGKAAGTTTIVVTGAPGVTDTVTVLVFPVAFTGTVAPTTVGEGDTIVISATPTVGFTTATTATIGGQTAFIRSVSASALVLFAGIPGAGQAIVINDLVLLGSIPIASLQATTAVTVNVAASEPANDAVGTAPTMPLPTTVGAYTEVIGTIDGTDIDDIYTITTTTADSIEMVVDWPDATTDIDIIFLNATGGFLNCSACTGADPERMRRRLAAATTYKIDVQMYATGSGTSPYVYRVRLYKRA